MSLVLRDVRKSYGAVEVLHGVSLEADYGSVVAIVGANGAGKSTLIKVLSGAHRRDSGDLELDGHPLVLRGPRDAIAHGIRTVYQELSLVPELTVTENLLMGALPRRRGVIDWRAAHRRAGEVLADIGFDTIRPRTRTSRLSVAKQQMVEIAKALVTEPKILVLDEPSAVLAGSDLDALFALIRTLTRRGTLVVYISHRLAEVMTLADRIVVMKDGSFIATTTPGETTEDELIRLMAGRRIEQIYPDRRTDFGPPTLEVKGLTRVGDFSDVSFQLHAGEILGLFGLVGSGRSELVETVFGARRATSGTVEVHGVRASLTSPRRAIRAGLALVTEDRKRTGLVLKMRVRENIALATMRGPVLNLAAQRRRVAGMVDELSIQPEGCAAMPVWQLSGGNQQKAVLAKWLLTRPRVLILDEPTRGVDMATRVDIYRMIDDLARQGLSVLVVSSDLTEAIGASDRLLVMRDGRLAGELASASTTEEEVLAYSIGTNL